MCLYIGDDGKFKVYLNGKAYKLNFYSTILITNGVRLLTDDDYILKDAKGLYITTKGDG
jgi:hypothetical protein